MRSGGNAGKATSAPASGGGSAPADGLYLASNEVPRADSVLTADWRGGIFYSKNADENSANGTPWQTGGADGRGWGGNISKPIAPANAVRNLAAIGKKPLFTRSDYVATTGVIADTDNNMAFHNLQGGNPGYAELWIRKYKFHVPANYFGPGNPSADYVWGGQKSDTINRSNDDSGIFWFAIGYNVGSSGSDNEGDLMATNNHGTNVVWHQNQSVNISQVPGIWYYEENHIKLNDVGQTNGVWELWVNDGGPTGDFSGQTPILRARHTNIDMGRVSGDSAALMGNHWLENWSNPDFAGSFGEQFWANLHIATSAPLGFAA